MPFAIERMHFINLFEALRDTNILAVHYLPHTHTHNSKLHVLGDLGHCAKKISLGDEKGEILAIKKMKAMETFSFSVRTPDFILFYIFKST